jgi:hypothetical protein
MGILGIIHLILNFLFLNKFNKKINIYKIN